ncbi:hypothetical protein KIN20_021687 [Parelaphostrongylus tenuis]|uniref:Uncharacterized protein n=1 Tax=Parelaphostrongylus tenuis TaxID=148309 RepID=A0AAD5N5I0_PARTN|nr:hypothetical protein KIN20_021687 [Parelaphostrongylus tenuis]
MNDNGGKPRRMEDVLEFAQFVKMDRPVIQVSKYYYQLLGLVALQRFANTSVLYEIFWDKWKSTPTGSR